MEALKADQEGRLEECIEKDKAALKIEEQPRTRLHLASCESRNGKLVDALKDAQRALELGIQKKDAGVMKVARTRVKELLERIPHVTFVPPPGVQDLSVKFDDRPVPLDALTKKFSVDPGKHKVVAEGGVNGFPATFDEEYDVKEKEFVTVRITLKPPANDYITPGQIKCMLAAKSQEDVQKCLPQNRKNIVIRAAVDLSAYSDTNSVAVYTPGINASIASPTAGWNIGGNMILDAVSAASPDIVSTASPPFEEFRYGGGLTGGYKPGLYGAQASGAISSSVDYVSYTGGIRLTADLNDKLITPTVGYSYSLRPHRPRPAQLPARLQRAEGRARHARGRGRHHVRHVADRDPPDRRNGSVRARRPVPAVSLHPDVRPGHGRAVRAQRRHGRSREPHAAPGPSARAAPDRARSLSRRACASTSASTTRRSASSSVSITTRGASRRRRRTHATWSISSRHLRVWPHLRAHAQSGVNFYQLAYSALLDPNGGITVPLYRTGDRELAPLLTGTGGGGVRIGLGEPEGEVKYGITLVGDVMYTRYLKALYVTTRTAVYGSVGFDVEF